MTDDTPPPSSTWRSFAGDALKKGVELAKAAEQATRGEIERQRQLAAERAERERQKAAEAAEQARLEAAEQAELRLQEAIRREPNIRAFFAD